MLEALLAWVGYTVLICGLGTLLVRAVYAVTRRRGMRHGRVLVWAAGAVWFPIYISGMILIGVRLL